MPALRLFCKFICHDFTLGARGFFSCCLRRKLSCENNGKKRPRAPRVPWLRSKSLSSSKAVTSFVVTFPFFKMLFNFALKTCYISHKKVVTFCGGTYGFCLFQFQNYIYFLKMCVLLSEKLRPPGK